MVEPNLNALSARAAKSLATETKTRVQIEGRTPRWLLQLLPYVEVSSGTYRVNRRPRVDLSAPKLGAIVDGDEVRIAPETLRRLPVFAPLDDATLDTLLGQLEMIEVEPDHTLLDLEDDEEEFFVIIDGKVEVSTIDRRQRKQVVAVLSDGDFFGEASFAGGAAMRGAKAVAVERSILLTLKHSAIQSVLDGAPALKASIDARVAELSQRMAAANAAGEDALAVTSRPDEGASIAPTHVKYDTMPQEYPLEIIQSVVRVQSRVADLYNGPYNQVEEQLRNAIEDVRERQEWELINHPRFGLLHQADPSMRIPTRTGPPTPDDLDELLALVWKEPAFFLAHPRAIAAFGRECTRRGVPPPTMHLAGSPVLTWRGVPLVPCDKLLVDGQQRPRGATGRTNILLLRVGEDKQGVVGLKTSALPGEQSPSLSVRLMGISQQAMQEYLLTLYYNVAVLTTDALAVLQNCEVGVYHDYDRMGR